VKGWLLDTNVISALINPNGAPSVKQWAKSQNEQSLFLSILTLGEYDKGISNLAIDDPDKQRYIAIREGLEKRFKGRTISVSDTIVRKWGEISGAVKRDTGHAPQVIDTMLAATAITNDLYLVTRNVKDTKGLGAIIFNPWIDDLSRFPLSPQK
jgi:predicted nucleic acid-binding protein